MGTYLAPKGNARIRIDGELYTVKSIMTGGYLPLIDTSDRRRFAATLRERNAVSDVMKGFFHRDEETGLYDHALYRGQWQDLAEAWCVRFPRRKKVVASETKEAWKAIRRAADRGEFPELAEIHADYEGIASELYRALSAQRDALIASLCEQAKGLDVPRGSFWQSLGSVCESDYRSQGLGAGKYARSAAEEIADRARFYGLEVTVSKEEAYRWEERHWRTGASYGEKIAYRYVVKARTTPLGVEILACKPEPSLRERVRACWARGVNPRVDMWWLDPDYEEREGLDHFGNEVARAAG